MCKDRRWKYTNSNLAFEDQGPWACWPWAINLHSATGLKLALRKKDVADIIKKQLKLAFQQVTMFSTPICKVHTAVYPTGLSLVSETKIHGNVCTVLSWQQELLPKEGVIDTSLQNAKVFQNGTDTTSSPDKSSTIKAAQLRLWWLKRSVVSTIWSKFFVVPL